MKNVMRILYAILIKPFWLICRMNVELSCRIQDSTLSATDQVKSMEKEVSLYQKTVLVIACKCDSSS